MNIKTITKLYLLLAIPLTAFFSCGDSSGGDPPPPPPEIVELTESSILGTWEVYYFNKTIYSTDLSISSTYRFTEHDGFTVTFEPNGVFYEENVFDMEILRGKYKIVGKDSIRFTFPSSKPGKDSTNQIKIPVLFGNRFVYQAKYHGTAHKEHYNIEDRRYYRHTVRGADYYSEELPAKDAMIDETKFLGIWSLTQKIESYNGQKVPETDEDRAEYGTLTRYTIENGKRIFRIYPPGEKVPIRVGEYKIIDDVVHMYWPDAPTDEEKSYKMWVWQFTLGSDGNYSQLKEGDIWRYIENSKIERESISFHKKLETEEATRLSKVLRKSIN